MGANALESLDDAETGAMMKRSTVSLLIVAFVLGVMAGGPADALAAAGPTLEEVVVTDTKLKGSLGTEQEVPGDYDPWEPFNDRIFTFNHDYFDKYLLKPAATGYDAVIGDGEKQVFHNMFENVAMPKRFVNSLLQGKFKGAGRELSRFIINSTLGGAGMTDVATYQFGIEKSDEDTGQTFAVWGWNQSRYLVLPILPPFTVRDAVGGIFDLALDPSNYFIPLGGGIGRYSDYDVNERALNLDTFESVEEGTLDLYSAVRNAYLNKREKQIKE